MGLLLSLVLLVQGVRMTEDFLPLAIGNRWVYDVSTEAGQKIGQTEFAVTDRTIISGRSLYVLSGFPFAGESAGPIKLIGYDREGRQFIRTDGFQDSPLFPGDTASTEILQSDTSGIPQKFSLRTGTTTLVFQRGVGIVEARLQTADGVRVARISSSSVGKGNALAPVVASAIPPVTPPAPAVPVSNVVPVTAENPVLVVSTEAVATGSAGVKLELLVINTANKLLPFKFSSSKSYDFVITDPATSREVWRWSHDMMFAQVIRSDSIRGNSKWTFSEVWNRRDNDRNPVPAGKYRLVGILASQPPLESEPVVIEIP